MKVANVVFKDQNFICTPAKFVIIKENWVEIYGTEFELLTMFNRDSIFCVEYTEMTEEEFIEKLNSNREENKHGE